MPDYFSGSARLDIGALHLPDCPKVHFVGIGGIGMSGLAKLLHEKGSVVTGSDQATSPILEQLRSLGVSIQLGHAVHQVTSSDLVIYSSAIAENNPELQWARALQKPIWHRAQLLQLIASSAPSIAVTGTHGKSSTTAILAHILRTASLPHTLVNGAICNRLQTNAYASPTGPILFEADESDGSFLGIHPTSAIITNLEADHLDHYNGRFEELKQAYFHFLSQVDVNGFIVLCGDDPELRSLRSRLTQRILTYGTERDTDYHLVEYRQSRMHAEMMLRYPSQKTMQFKLNLPGRHHALNAAAAIAAAHQYGCKDVAIAEALATYPGIHRRLQPLGLWRLLSGHLIRCFSDYGHHPTEIDRTRETLQTAWPAHRLMHIFEPHRYSRTKLLASSFVNSLQNAHQLILLETYAAGETPESGMDSIDLAACIDQYRSSPTPVLPATAEWFEQLYSQLHTTDLLLFQGAGQIGKLAESFTQYLLAMGAESLSETAED